MNTEQQRIGQILDRLNGFYDEITNQALGFDGLAECIRDAEFDSPSVKTFEAALNVVVDAKIAARSLMERLIALAAGKIKDPGADDDLNIALSGGACSIRTQAAVYSLGVDEEDSRHLIVVPANSVVF